MISERIKKELDKVEVADLSHYDEASHTFFIPRRKDIKLEVDKTYLIHLLPSFYTNSTLKINWNQNTVPQYPFLVVEVSKIMAKMFKGIAVGYDADKNEYASYHWEGWFNLDNIEILQAL